MCIHVCWVRDGDGWVIMHLHKVSTEARGVRSLGVGVTSGREPPSMSAENWPGILRRATQTEPSFFWLKSLSYSLFIFLSSPRTFYGKSSISLLWDIVFKKKNHWSLLRISSESIKLKEFPWQPLIDEFFQPHNHFDSMVCVISHP